MDRCLTISFGNFKFNLSVLKTLAVLFLGRPSIIYFFRCFGVRSNITAALIICAIGILYILAVCTSIKNVCIDGIALVALAAVFFFITLKLHPEYILRYEDVYFDGRYGINAVFSISGGIYAYYVIRLFKYDSEALYDILKPLAYILMVGNMFRPFFEKSELSYSMDFGYNMALAAIIFLALYFFDKKNNVHLFLSIFTIGFSIVNGARASVIGYITFIFLYFVWERALSFKKLIIVSFGFVAAIMYNSPNIMQNIYYFFKSIGFDSRTLYLISNGDILSADTARQTILWPTMVELLKSSSFFKIYGAYGDRYYIKPIYPYCHNMVLEILVTFGKFFGIIILIWLSYRFLELLLHNNKTLCVVAMVFGCFSISRLMFSSSFWYEPYFWAWIATLVNGKRHGIVSLFNQLSG